MVSAYPGLFYPGQVYPGQVDATPPPPPPPPTGPGDTGWGSWRLGRDGTWIRRETRVLVWTPSAGTSTPHLTTETGNILTTEAGDRIGWPPPVTTITAGYLLTETGNVLTTEAADRLTP